MKKEGYWVIRTYRSGRIGEKIKYWVPGKKAPRSGRSIRSDIRKQKQNESDSVKRLARIINENFQGGDVFDALTYSPEAYKRITEGKPAGLTEEETRDWIRERAEHELELFLRRCRYACKKAGVECRYIAITSDMDGETGEPVRVHHHIVASDEIRGIISECWQNGLIKPDSVWKENDHTGLAKYLLDQVRRIPDSKKYKRSRNLEIPEPKDRVAKTGKEVQPPKGAEILFRSEYAKGRPQYIRYFIPDKETGGGPKKKPKKGGAAEWEKVPLLQ